MREARPLGPVGSRSLFRVIPWQRYTGGVIDELKKRYPSDRFPACAVALDSGIDVMLLEANLRLTPAERLQAHMRQLRLQERLQAASLSAEQLRAIERRALLDKLERFGPQTNQDSPHA